MKKELKLKIQRNAKGHRIFTQIDLQILSEILESREQGLQFKQIEHIIHDKYYKKTDQEQDKTEQEVALSVEAIQQQPQVDIYEQLAALTKEVAELRRIAEGRRPALIR